MRQSYRNAVGVRRRQLDRSARLTFETLERRLVLDAGPLVIGEFMVGGMWSFVRGVLGVQTYTFFY